MATTPICPKCGKSLETGAPQGLWPACLMAQRASFPNADNREVRLVFQTAAVRTLDSEPHR